MNEDWPNQLAALLAQQGQPEQMDYWGMMAANQSQDPRMTQGMMSNPEMMNRYLNQIQGVPQQQSQQPQQQQNQAARQGLAPQTPAQIQAKQLAEIMRRRLSQ